MQMWTSIVERKDTSKLNRFLLITFADLKKYQYYYWFAFPAFVAKPAWEIADDGWKSADDKFSAAQVPSLPQPSDPYLHLHSSHPSSTHSTQTPNRISSSNSPATRQKCTQSTKPTFSQTMIRSPCVPVFHVLIHAPTAKA